MGLFWAALTLASCALAWLGGTGSEASRAILESGGQGVRLLLDLMGPMVMWSGLMEILVRRGDVARLGRGLRALLRPLFPQLRDEESWAAMGMNVAANLLGLGNAATPAGIEAARRLSAQGETGLRALAMLLALNNSSLQLIPSTVMALRAAAGAANPADIWGPTLLSSGAATAVAALLMLLLNRRGERA